MLKPSPISLALVLLVATAASLAQQPRLPPGIGQGPGIPVPVVPGDDEQKQVAKAAAEQRQLAIRRDSEKMLQLTTELNTYLQKNDQNTLSIDAIKKAEQIEKLARSVKSKLKQVY
jgi:hypothetical protein